MYAKMVAEFAKACGDLKNKPGLLNNEDKRFIREMVNDELDELDLAETIVDQADAIVDAIVYLLNCACRKGIDIDPLMRIVCDANNRKIVNGKVIRREDGKVLKPEGWYGPEPELEKEIDRQLTEGSFNIN